MKISDRFWELMAKSTITSGAIALCLIVTSCSLWFRGLLVPDQLYALLYSVVGFFFVSKTASEARGHSMSEVKDEQV